VYDLQSTDYVLSVGAALLEAWSSPVYMMRAYGEFRQGRSGRRGKLVQVEPRLSITGASADEWIAVKPGTQGILALGVAQVLVAEGLYNAEFIRLRTNGLEDHQDEFGGWSEGLRSYLTREYSLERVSKETGISGNTILRLAREFAAARNKVAIGPRHGPLVPGTLFDHLATQVLNALAGNLDGPGGVLVPEDVPLQPWSLPTDPVAEAGRRRPRLDGGPSEGLATRPADPDQLLAGLLTGPPYSLEVLMVMGADPMFASVAPERLKEAIEKIPLVISFASLPDDTALLADYILPETHFLESWDLHTSPPGVPYPLVSLAQPVLEKPVFDARPVAEVLMSLARRIGGEMQRAFPGEGLTDLIRKEIDGLYEAKRGAIMGTPFDEAWVRMMERAGWWAPGYQSAEDLWKKMRASGGWWDPFYDHEDWKRVLQTRSGRYEFRTDLLRRLAQQRSSASAKGVARSGASSEPGASDRDSLALHLFEPLPIAGGSGAELPFLQALLDPGHPEAWETWVEIHPETAARLGLKDRSWVRVSSAQGSIEARLRVTLRVVAGLAAIPVGLGKQGGGRWAAGRGANPLPLLTTLMDPVSGQPHYGPTRVSIASLSDEEREPTRARRG
jgi:anaerobic selenocysteine-containing dehydrogenase